MLRNTGTAFIYALLDPLTREVRYIGKADNPKARLANHLAEANKRNNHRTRWLRSVMNHGMKPILEILDEVPQHEWPSWEAAYIEFFLEQGCKLVNGTRGGEGSQNPTAEVRAKRSLALRGRKLSAGHRAKISASLRGKKGKPLSPENIAKLAAYHRGRPKSPEQRAKMSAAQKGEKHPFFGKKQSPESIAKRIAAQKGRVFSTESKARVSAGLRAAWARRKNAGQLMLFRS
jgi:group I intron endonuclease